MNQNNIHGFKHNVHGDDEDADVGLLSSNALDEEDHNGTYNSSMSKEMRTMKIKQVLNRIGTEKPGLYGPLNTVVSEWNQTKISRAKDELQSLFTFVDDDDSSLSYRTGLIVVLMSIIFGIWMWSTQQVQHYGVLKYDQDWNKLHLSDVESYCLDKKSSRCIHDCPNPLTARHRKNHKTWEEAYYGNVREALIAAEMRHVDVVFYGDSIVEGWKGMKLGRVHPFKLENARIFEKYFVRPPPPKKITKKRKQPSDNSTIINSSDQRYVDPEFRALALGISGDKTYNLLWRLQHEEMPEKLNPSVWWVVIGTNDFGPPDKPHCSPDLVYMGIIRVVEEIRARRSDAIIVINSVLPRSEDQGNLINNNAKPEKLSVWQGILEVNRRLKKYCSSDETHNIVFFDATSLFLRQRPNTKGLDGQYIPDSLMADYVHPTVKGYDFLGKAVIKELRHLSNAKISGRRPFTHDPPKNER